MHPILFEIPRLFEFQFLGDTYVFGPIPIRMYGLMIGIGFLLGITLASRRGKKGGDQSRADPGHGRLSPARGHHRVRLLYVLTSLHEFTRNPFDVFAIWKGGLVFYGGLLGAVPVGIWYVKKHSLPVWQTADIVAPSIALGHAFGRLGCFFAGCCYGGSCTGPFCITFSDPQSLAPLGMPLFPTQLMESGGEFLIFCVLMLLSRYKRFHGQIFGLYLLLYAVLRFILEFFRGDLVRGVYFGGAISTSQIIAIVIAVIALAGMVIGQSKGRIPKAVPNK